MKLSVSIILICVLVACQPKNQATTSPAELEESSVSVFTKDTQVNLHKASLVVPKGWRLAIDDTAGVAIMTTIEDCITATAS